MAYYMVYGMRVEYVTRGRRWAARRSARGEQFSLADRLCLALGERLDADISTADQAWGTDARYAKSSDHH